MADIEKVKKWAEDAAANYINRAEETKRFKFGDDIDDKEIDGEIFSLEMEGEVKIDLTRDDGNYYVPPSYSGTICYAFSARVYNEEGEIVYEFEDDGCKDVH